jgi:hypothetical protein
MRWHFGKVEKSKMGCTPQVWGVADVYCSNPNPNTSKVGIYELLVFKLSLLLS